MFNTKHDPATLESDSRRGHKDAEVPRSLYLPATCPRRTPGRLASSWCRAAWPAGGLAQRRGGRGRWGAGWALRRGASSGHRAEPAQGGGRCRGSGSLMAFNCATLFYRFLLLSFSFPVITLYFSVRKTLEQHSLLPKTGVSFLNVGFSPHPLSIHFPIISSFKSLFATLHYRRFKSGNSNQGPLTHF